MAPARWTACMYHAAGRECPYGARCKFRHTVDGLVVVNQPQTPLPDKHHRRTMALLVDDHIKATVAAGLVPVTVENLHLSKLGLRIEKVNTSVTLRWSPSTRTFSLLYDSYLMAFRACSKLNGARLMDSTLACATDIPDDNGAVTLQVFDVPWWISEDNILDALPSALRVDTKNITLTKSTQKPNFQVVREVVARQTKLSPTHMKEDQCRSSLSRMIKIYFEGSPKLDGVARALNGQELQQFGRIHCMELVEVHLVLHAAIYERYRGLLKSCAHRVQNHPKCNVHFDEESSGSGAHVRLLISGTDREALISAKGALDKVLIRNTIGRLSQPPLPPRQTHRLVLTKVSDFVNATQGGGLRKAQDLLGDDIVHLDTTASHPAIVVRGNSGTLRHVQRCLNWYGSLPQSKKVFCEVCWDEDDDFVKVEGCRHVACKDCFVQYCTLSRDKKFPLHCFQTNCKTLLPVHEVRLALGEDAFHRLLSEAIETHFRQDPATHIKCPGPDCTSYFTANDGETDICPSCFTTSCHDCKAEYHFGESCENYQQRITGDNEKLQEWMEKEGAKHCPNCNGIVQKDAGCNHIECFLCKQHFCFACLKMFDKEENVYKHMAVEHGSYYANQQEEREANERLIRLVQADEERLGLPAAAEEFPQPVQPVQPVRPAQPHHPRLWGLERVRPPPQLHWPQAPPQQVFAPFALVEMRPIGAGGAIVRRTQAEIDEQLARQEGLAEWFDDEDPGRTL